MIPHQLRLKNFLSYRDATLDFRGLHVACVCGANGAGKSSLLEAIAWSIWGNSRALSEDDVIHQGETEARVDFIFAYHQQTYRVIRSRYRGQSSTLEFQVQTATGFRSLTGRGVRATQHLILQHLKLDYDTFINSAYLRQGRADEFMLKRPSERKQILADLLKLEQYDSLSEQAKERSRQLKAEITLLERNITAIHQQLQAQEQVAQEQIRLSVMLADLQQHQQRDQAALRQLQTIQQQRQSWQQQLTLQRQQYENLTQDCQRLQQELLTLQQQQQTLEQTLQDSEAIALGYAQLQALQAAEEEQTARCHAHQAAQLQRQQLKQQQTEAINTLKDQIRQLDIQLEALHQQAEEASHTLQKTDEVAKALDQLRQSRLWLAQLDQLQIKVTPLLQRRQHVQAQIDRQQTRLSARLEELQSLTQTLQAEQQTQPQLRQAVTVISEKVEHLEQRRRYQQKVREKGTERKNFMERLQERQREVERQLGELEQKIQLLQKAEDPAAASLLCPLCDRPLDEHHRQVVLQRHQAEQAEMLRQLWVMREQLTTSDREIEILRQEYRDLEKELADYHQTLEHRGRLQQQLQGTTASETRLQQLLKEQEELERSLHQSCYAQELQEELQQLNRLLEELQYDDRNHALARGEADRWRWAEIKQAEMKQAQQRLEQITQRQPILVADRLQLQQQLQTLSQSSLQQQIDALDRHLVDIAYSVEQHTALRNVLRQAQQWQLRYQELLQAQQLYPQVYQRVGELSDRLMERSQSVQALQQQIALLTAELEETVLSDERLHSLEARIQQQRSQLDDLLGQLGRLQQQQQQLANLKEQQEQEEQQIQGLKRQYRVYLELAQAFSKNGIQTLMIENVLPQLEAEANQILGRLSNHQLHVQFVTQKAGRRKGGDKLIDTLDILIADTQATRPYETYSGGEAFRVNFAIRLALARLLAQRSGAALQLLIIDEGFGTQDAAGCDRLIAAINAIAPEFACILTVTHIPHLKEAFQAHIEVYKTETGSHLDLLV